jgi:hypothetical protein
MFKPVKNKKAEIQIAAKSTNKLQKYCGLQNKQTGSL